MTANDFDSLKKQSRRWLRLPQIGKLIPRLLTALIVFSIVVPLSWVLLYSVFPSPGTILMAKRHLEGQKVRRVVVSLDQISPDMVRAVIAAEDARFCSHDGFDVDAIQDATEYNKRQKERGSKKRRGASTISQQTAKNLFLWPDRNFVRKGLEVYFTGLSELVWPKRRIMEHYLNVAEWGDGLFGVEAAAQGHFGKHASELTAREAARLAAVLPSPNKWSAAKPGPYVRRRAGAIEQRMRVIRAEGLAACVLGQEKSAPRPKKAPAPLPEMPAIPPELAPPEENAPAAVALERVPDLVLEDIPAPPEDGGEDLRDTASDAEADGSAPAP